MTDLAERIHHLFDNPPAEVTDEHRELFNQFKQKRNTGEVRAADRVDGNWRVNHWVKRGILLGFRWATSRTFDHTQFRLYDKYTYPLKRITPTTGPHSSSGSSIRDGLHRKASLLPPMFSTPR